MATSLFTSAVPNLTTPAPQVQLAILASSINRNIGGLVFDATFSEEHTSELEVTENPVEEGADVTDNSYMKALRLTINAGVSNTPLTTSNSDILASANLSRIQAAFTLLRDLQASGQPFSIQTGLLLYTNMVCLRCKNKQDAKSFNVFDFVADFKQIIIVSTQTTTYKPTSIANSGPTTTKGTQQATQVTAPTSISSLLLTGAKFLGFFAQPTTGTAAQ